MVEISIKEIDLTTFEVIVAGPFTTTHLVKVAINYALSLTASKISTEQLVKNAFEFLLAREPNTSILREFELSVIRGYFPDFELEMRNKIPAR